MDFKQIMAMKSDISSLSKKRHQESDISQLKGFEYLEKSFQTEFQDHSLLHEALDHFMVSLNHNRRNPDPYVSIGYLFLILGKKNRALRYLTEAKRVSPGHTLANQLIFAIESHEAHLREALESEEGSPSSSEPEMLDIMSLPVLSSDRDYDLLYDQIEGLLLDKTRELMDQGEQIQVQEDLSLLEPLKLLGRNLKTLTRHVDRQIQVIDREIETSDLRHKLIPLEAMLRRIQDVRKSSSVLVQLGTDCTAISGRASSLLRDLKQGSKPVSVAEADVEEILDECDRLADVLDGISAKGHNITFAEDAYGVLIQEVEILQDAIDDLG